MNAKLLELAERRAVLTARAAAQRLELSLAWAPWRGPLAAADRAWAAARYLRSNPFVLGGLAAFLIVLRPWRMARWLPPGWMAWRLARTALRAKGILPGW